jgi:hypothetical protein
MSEVKPMPFAVIPEGLYCIKLLEEITIAEMFLGLKEVKAEVCPYYDLRDDGIRVCNFLKEEMENGLKSCQINVGMEG